MGSTATRSTRALDVDAAERALRNARSVSNDGRPRQAHALYARLRDRLPADAAPHVAVRTLLGLATTGYELDGDADRAMALLDDARSRADAAADGRLQVAVGGQIGLLHLRRGRTDDAIAAFDRIAHGLDGADPHDSGAVLINRGVLWLDQLSLRRARSDFARCSEVAAGSGDVVLEFMARHNLGFVEFLAGDLPQALADMAASARVDPGAPRPTGMLDEARVMVEAGLCSDAEARLAAAQELFGTQGLVHDVAETECARAEVAITERRWADARRLSRSARRAFARRGNGRWGQNAHLLELRARLGTIDDAGAPLTAHRAARTELVRIGRDAVELAATLSAAGRRDAARTALLVALEGGLAHPHPPATYEVPSIRSTDPFGLRLHVRRVRARQAWARGDEAAAGREVRSTFRDIAAHRGRFGSIDLRTAIVRHVQPIATLEVEHAIRTRTPTAVFRAVERWRSLSTQVADVAPERDDEAAELLADLRAISRARAEIADDRSADPAAAGRDAELAIRQASVERELRAREWDRHGEGGTVEVAGPAAVEEGLCASGHSAVMTFAAGGTLWAVRIRPGERMRLIGLGPVAAVHALRQRVQADLSVVGQEQVPEPILAVVSASLERGLSRLDAVLVAPLGLEDEPVVVMPQAELSLLPWGLLPSRRGRATTVMPSATGWLTALSGGAGGAAGAGAGVAGRVAAVAGPGLAHAVDEVVEVAAGWPGARARTGADATCRSVEEALGSSTLVHLAAHGRHRPQSPLFSTLDLADGPLFAHELDRRAPVPDVVVLSACELGLATVRPGDQALGWTAVLLARGARCVIAGVESVNDALTQRVMVDLHARLRRGTDTATAVAEALETVRSEGRCAPFAVFGAGVPVTA